MRRLVVTGVRCPFWLDVRLAVLSKTPLHFSKLVVCGILICARSNRTSANEDLSFAVVVFLDGQWQ